MAYAQQVGKPVMIDFTGWSCVNCRKMEDNVWSQPAVLKIISEDYVLISLYVDDKTPLPESKQFVSASTGKKVKSTGNKWSEMQSRIYQTNSQPYYVIINNEEKVLISPQGFNLDIKNYINFLDEGKRAYNTH